MTIFSRFLKNESGATAIEYALIAALMAAALITAMTTLGGNISDGMTTIGGKVAGAVK